jgi:hypothetical protein
MRMENKELYKAIARLFRELAEKEKKAAISSGDYATAFVAALVEGVAGDAEMTIQ